jgi:LacI family transcriptional regulator, galactose operon repressor
MRPRPAIVARAGKRRTGHVTLQDIARASDLSTSTVSLVLSEGRLSKKIAAETRERVRIIARKMGYHPDAYARSLRRRRTQTIAVLAFDLSDPFCLPLIRGIESGLRAAEYTPLLMDAQGQRKLFDRLIALALEARADGVIVVASWLFDETGLLADIEKNRVPIVVLGRDLTEVGVSSILVDNEAGGALALQHLASLGHQRVAVIRGPRELWDSEPRWRGVREAAEQAGIDLDERLIVQLPSIADPMSGFEGGVQAVTSLLAARRRFSAVIAFDDLTALGVIRGLSQAGLRVPQDCSVIGFDDVLPAKVATPAVSTIRQPLIEMGRQAAERVLLEIGQSAAKKERPWLHKPMPELLARKSTSRPPRRKHDAGLERA